MSKLSPEERRELREYAWKYFETHANHRLQVFNFYLVLASLTIGALITLPSTDGGQSFYIAPPAILAFLSFVFWKFEERTRMLVKNGEEALRYLDREVVDPAISPLALFERDDQKTSKLPKWPLTTGHFSYSRVFRWVYAFFGFGASIICAAYPFFA